MSQLTAIVHRRSITVNLSQQYRTNETEALPKYSTFQEAIDCLSSHSILAVLPLILVSFDQSLSVRIVSRIYNLAKTASAPETDTSPGLFSTSA